MKVILLLMVAITVAAAVEDSVDQMVKICGDDLAKALQQACEHKNVEYLLKKGHYDPHLEFDHKHQHRDHHRRDHDRDHNHDHGHDQVHDGHDHDHALGHDHSIHHLDNHSHAEKKKNENDRSIVEECCDRACPVKDFISFCG